jgi:hypothetical protein
MITEKNHKLLTSQLFVTDCTKKGLASMWYLISVLYLYIFKVNGVDMTMLNHFEAVTYLHKAPSIVTIRVYRDPITQKSVNYTEDIVSEEEITQVLLNKDCLMVIIQKI